MNMETKNRSIVILGTDHQLQGAENGPRLCEPDPDYEALVLQLIEDFIIDFIFEEMTGLGPTIASGIAQQKFGVGHYLDVDPPKPKRSEFGIKTETGDCYWIGSSPGSIIPNHWGQAGREYLDAHEKREKLWCMSIHEQRFRAALMICGMNQVVSFGLRLQEMGYVCQAFCYNPSIYGRRVLR